MSRKLVYADDIYRYIKTEINPYGKPFEGSAYELGLKIMKHIENMSAAYDVDKVVEQLEAKTDEAKDEYCNSEGLTIKHYYDGLEDGFRESIEIAKVGGIG